MAGGKVIEVWQTPNKSWTWEVLRKYSKNDDKPHARWFCRVKSPYTPDGELGDVYVSEIKSVARKIRGGESRFGDKSFDLPIPDRLKNDSGLWYPGKRIVRYATVVARGVVAAVPTIIQTLRLSKPTPLPTMKHSIQSIFDQGKSLFRRSKGRSKFPLQMYYEKGGKKTKIGKKISLEKALNTLSPAERKQLLAAVEGRGVKRGARRPMPRRRN